MAEPPCRERASDSLELETLMPQTISSHCNHDERTRAVSGLLSRCSSMGMHRSRLIYLLVSSLLVFGLGIIWSRFGQPPCTITTIVSGTDSLGSSTQLSTVDDTNNDAAALMAQVYNRVSAVNCKTYFDSSRKFSFVHISKCAGATFIRLLKAAPLQVCPRAESGGEYSVWHQHNVKCKDADYFMVSLRSPRHHVWSMFTECKHDKWGKKVTKDTNFPRSGNKPENDTADFDLWLESFLPMAPGKEESYHCYHPANYQSRHLTSHKGKPHGVVNGQYEPNVTLARDTYRAFDFVALADFVHESRCLFYYRLGHNAPTKAVSYLNDACNCHNQSGANDVHVSHHTGGHRATLRDLPHQTLAKVENLTAIDTEIYTTALWDFMARIAWLESDSTLGRRVLCDNILEKWEPELAYLHLSVTKLYDVSKAIASSRRI